MKTPSELSARIRELCRAKNALILVHNYELGEVQEIADHVSHCPGGRGFVRSVIEMVMKLQGKWTLDVGQYKRNF